MATNSYAEVIVDITAKKLDKTFHYRIPDALAGRLVEGMRVIVPFGRRKLEGYILGFSQSADVAETKDIIAVVDDEPILNRDLLALAGWMAERYMCPVVEVIHAMMPAGARLTGRRYVSPEPGRSSALCDGAGLTTQEWTIYKYIVNHGKTPYKQILSLYGPHKGRAAVQKLVEMGLVKISDEMKSKVRARTVQSVELAVSEPGLSQAVAALRTRAPRQASVLELLRDKGCLEIKDAAALAGTTPATVRQLVNKGLVLLKEAGLRRDPYGDRCFTPTTALVPSAEQKTALQKITGALKLRKPDVFLLRGVTGSGKTEVYLQAIAESLRQGRQAVVLVPEISLTPQMVERFKGRFGSLVAVLHSRLSDGERHDEWRAIKEGRVQVAVGARSAVFAPFHDLGLLIIDEEHETSYKQDDNPKYHAREVALARARLCGGVVVLGSATPSMESFARAAAGQYKLLSLDGRVTGQPLPKVEIVDLRQEMQEGHRSIFSRQLINLMNDALEKQEQVILFLNRRGYSTFVICRECGYLMKCPKCSLSLTLHAGDNVLRCHYCDYRRKAPETCPGCGSKNIRHFGVGTQKVEEEAARWFPDARVARMDVDTTTTKGSHENILRRFKERQIDILVGTQMIAKGLDFPGVTLVGVITADTALNLPEFRAAERTFQLLTQVAGRAGRGSTPGQVVVQTYSPEHYSIIRAREHDFLGFYGEEIRHREVLQYPPYSALVRIVIFGTEENSVIRGAEILGSCLQQAVAGIQLGVDQPLLGPAPAPLAKLRNRYRWHICIRGKPAQAVRQVLREALQKIEKDPYFKDIGISVDVDPVSLM